MALEDDQTPKAVSNDSLDHDEEKGSQPDEEQRGACSDEEKAESEPSPPPNAGPGPPPNGGLTAWLQVLGSWMLFFNTWGILK